MWTVDQLREWLDIEGQQEHDVLLEALEARSVELIEIMTGRSFATAASAGSFPTLTEILSGKGEPALWLQESPSAITSVSYRTTLDGAWTAYLATDYEQDGRKLIYVWGDWPSGYRNLKAIYKAGYLTGQEPGDIRQAVLNLVTFQYRAGRKLTIKEAGSLSDLKGVTDIAARYRSPLF